MLVENSHLELPENRLLKPGDYFQNIVETVREPLIVLDSDLRVKGASRSFYQTFSVTREETEGRLIYELGDRQWDIPALRTLLEDILPERTQFNGFEVVHEFPRVGRRVILLNARQVVTEDSSATMILLAIEDITDRKLVEETLRLYAAKLERSNRELQDFAQVASHDLQEPLRKILAFGDRLKTKAGASLDEECRDYLQRMFNAATRMQTLITDLMTFSRIETKAQPFVPVDLGVIASEVSADLETRIEQTGGRVEIEELPTINADPLQMRQLLQNLIGNSLKYYRAGVPPVVRIYSQNLDEPSHESIDESILAPPLCQIFVEDNGIGFDEKYLDRIFTVFQRLHKKGEYEGTGVGLAICRKIVERHGGTITARSSPGQGATFIVTLPVRQPKEVEV
ncbi:MAG: PAS domain S-box protein [Pyrinomonadaceae bacterium]|nr:PAS domain S-box protein [Pyrinomonadaceae bacterium]